GLDGGENEIWCRRGKDLAGYCGVQHALSDESAVKRFVPRAAARHQRDLALPEMPAQHERRGDAEANDIGMLRAEAGETLLHQILNCIDQLLHATLPYALGSTILDQ